MYVPHVFAGILNFRSLSSSIQHNKFMFFLSQYYKAKPYATLPCPKCVLLAIKTRNIELTEALWQAFLILLTL